jgi:flagellin-like hook-associated protein FlgL
LALALKKIAGKSEPSEGKEARTYSRRIQMALIINHNMTAQNAARNLSTIYDRLSTSVQRLSSGLRINSAADDAAGLAIREMMRADIATMNQGIRNTADAISMIQTADGALGVIDEKLVRMKELAEQAATGTYTTAQREIINSEYQAMAAEIDRIATATDFNGIKLLDGSVTNQHSGQGLKIHFGVSNDQAEDYYFVNIGDSRATSSTGLRIGGDAKNDIWGQGAAGSGPLAGPGCCTAGYESLDGAAGFISGQTFSYGYNWDWTEDNDAALLSGKYLAGRYTVSGTDSLQDLINKVNAGTQSRVGVQIGSAAAFQERISAGGTVAVCVGDEAYFWGSEAVARGGEEFTSSYIFTYTNDEFENNTADGGNLWATGSLMTLLNGDTLSLSQEVFGSYDAAAGQAALANALAAMTNGGLLLTSAGQAATAVVTLASLGITATSMPQGSANFSTGIYNLGNGRWTNSAGLAQALGFNGYEVTFEVTARGYTSAAAVVTYTGSDVDALPYNYSSGTNTTTLVSAGIWFNGTNYTTDRGLANQLGWTEMVAIVSAMQTSNVNANTLANNAFINSLAGFVSDGTNSANFETGVYVDTQGRWTTSATVANTLGGFQEVTLNLQSAMATTTGITMDAELSTGGLISARAAGGISYPVAAGAMLTFNLWTSGIMWTDDASVASQLGFNQVSFNAAANIADAADLLAEFTTAVTPGAYTQKATGVTPSTSTAEAAAQLLGKVGSSHNTRIYALGDDFTTMANKINTEAGNLGLANEVTGFEPRGLGAGDPTYDNLDAALNGLDSRIGTTALTTFNGPTVLPADIDSTEGAGMIEIVEGAIDSSKDIFQVASNSGDVSLFTARALASAINANVNSQFWAMIGSGASSGTVYVFTKEGGNFNDLLACDVAGSDENSRLALDYVGFENQETGNFNNSGTTFSLGGQHWATMKPTQTKASLGNEVWNVTLNGRDVGDQRDIWIANAGEIETPNLFDSIINGMDRNSFVEIQNAADGPWKGAEVRTQSAAQEALDAITEAINTKDKIRADLGALQNRLENTMTNLTVQAENLQAAESRISDVDVALEMTEFTRNNVLAQAATSMLAQANSLSQLALSLIG